MPNATIVAALEPLAYEVGRLQLDPANARRHDQRNVDAIKASLTLFGQRKPIVATEAGVVIAGNGTLQAAKELGWERIAVVFVNDDTAKAAAYGIADNRTAELAAWDDDVLGTLLGGLADTEINMADLGFTARELATLIGNTQEEKVGDGDACPGLKEDSISQRGEIFELGPHRLMCGDSTCADDWQALLGSEMGDAVITDPPYGINYVGGCSDPRAADYRQGDHIENDDEESLPALLDQSLGLMLERCKPGGCWYVCGPSARQAIVFGAWLVSKDILRQILVWNKDRFVFGRSDYHCKFETIFYGWKPGAAHMEPPDRTQTSVWDCDRPTNSDDHPTMKPVALMERMINNSTLEKQIILEPFAGSGTTLIAAARTGRICRAMEIAPRYCDVIRRRWTKHARENGVPAGSGVLDP
jgi:site-specific DNA-methyltransferase (adenine-specific)